VPESRAFQLRIMELPLRICEGFWREVWSYFKKQGQSAPE